MDKVDTSGTCWIWTAGCNPQGYGRFHLGGSAVLAHRVSYELHIGPIPAGAYVLHSCDNPPCVNPAHLRAGTAAENTADMFARGRVHRPFGDDNPRCKISDAQLGQIRDRVRAGETRAAIAAELAVHPSHVGRIVNGRRRTRS